jgi:hypothetical protein
MKYIAKSKHKNSFKQIDDITKFKKDEFNQFELYEVTPITESKYDDIIKNEKVTLLLGQLKDLGIDLNALQGDNKPQESVIPQQSIGLDDIGKENPFLQSDTTSIKPNNNIDSNVVFSEIKKGNTNDFFTMAEIKTHYFNFKQNIEEQLSELSHSDYDEKGIILYMVETIPNFMRQLPNGIPVRQVAI